jgi:hypothetical protein
MNSAAATTHGKYFLTDELDRSASVQFGIGQDSPDAIILLTSW